MEDLAGYVVPSAVFVVLFAVLVVVGRRRERAQGVPQKPILRAVAPVMALVIATVLVTAFTMSLDTAAARIGTLLAFFVLIALAGGVAARRGRAG